MTNENDLNIEKLIDQNVQNKSSFFNKLSIKFETILDKIVKLSASYTAYLIIKICNHSGNKISQLSSCWCNTFLETVGSEIKIEVSIKKKINLS